ncbi:MAG: hypothetical protein KKA19_04630 [Candidatus Margulisbacteria bacterium]|nr:hypothetical protein [Candidatus Margulisiibacteriota bacterium]
MNIKKLIIYSLLIVFLGSAGIAESLLPERSLGGVKLGDNYKEVQKKYKILEAFKSLEEVTLPYPLNVLDKETVFLAQHKSLDLVVFLDKNTTQVKALATFFYREEDTKDYETEAGLRVGDSIIAAKLLYGEPAKISSYVYYYPEKKKVEENIYYYRDLCVHTQISEGVEIITSIVVGKYDLLKTLTAINQPISQIKTQETVELSHKKITMEEKIMKDVAKEEVVQKKEKITWWKIWAKKKEKIELVEPKAQVVTPPKLEEKEEIVKKEIQKKEVKSTPKQKSIQAKTTVRKEPEILFGEKIEVAEKVLGVSKEFINLIELQRWRDKIKYEERTGILSVTAKMTREDLDYLKKTPEAAPYAKTLENLFIQF